MPFALQLQESLLVRGSQVAFEFAAGENLETVLSRHLVAVESSADTELLTSILLLEGNRLWHGAAPSLPKSYCEPIDGIEIGPDVGSCGTAAYLGHAVYVTDVATDPLWKDYRELALQHGLRACWSTPIRNSEGAMIGTFAVYHPTPRSPTPDELNAIRLITGHVAQAIEWSHEREAVRLRNLTTGVVNGVRMNLKLVSNNFPKSCARTGFYDEEGFSARLLTYAARLEAYAGRVASQAFSDSLKTAARDCRNVVDAIRSARNDQVRRTH